MEFFKKLFKLILKVLSLLNNSFNYLQIKLNGVEIEKGWNIKGKVHIRNYGTLIIGKRFNANSSKYANPIGGDSILRLKVKKIQF